MEKEFSFDQIQMSDIYNRPEWITLLLYQKLMQKIEVAIDCIEKKEYIQANRAIQYSQNILVRLGFGIYYEAGILADQLESLYQYMNERLSEANIKKDSTLLRAIFQMVGELEGAWKAAMDKERITSDVQAPFQKPVGLNPYQRQEMYNDRYAVTHEKSKKDRNFL